MDKGLVMMISNIRWHLRAEAKKRLSVDTELAAPYLTQVEASKYFYILPVLQIVVENDYGGKVAVPIAHQLGYMTACYANNNNGPRWLYIMIMTRV